jgi:Yip1 domain
MDGIVGTLKLGWDALLLKEKAYEEMKGSSNPVVRGLIFLLIVGLAIALLNLIGTTLEWATTPNMADMQDTIYRHIVQMPWYDEATAQSPEFAQLFERWYNQGWDLFPLLSGAPSIGGAAMGIVSTPLGLFVRWLIYGLLAYLFARALHGTGSLSETLGVLALAGAPQMLNVLGLLPFVTLGSIVSVWSILCAYVGLKVAHRLSWQRAVWATLLPFILALVIVLLAACMGSAIGAAVLKGASQ